MASALVVPVVSGIQSFIESGRTFPGAVCALRRYPSGPGRGAVPGTRSFDGLLLAPLTGRGILRRDFDLRRSMAREPYRRAS